MVTLLIVVGLIGGTCALIYGMVMLAMMVGKKSKGIKAQTVVASSSPAKRAHTTVP
ncbi:hypothetical protein [Pigmentiphaga litoralis]|uniref:Uncharacterized protein n=1 Tax=Pigmentiphaga litoralis TaxID=516702 RepID=A0A7Y9IXD5_9BURK|nr:hypothetical protein [Pigmentiphaga litoralis]NYE25731.1 hypothetical protein [Pigmentiphaga litoralis]NYE84851.1 hypothetical protein [Pigmentiphaga litoralis]